MPDTGIRHEVSVKKLRELLTQLNDEDVLIPNQVAHLALIRNGSQIGFIDLLPDFQEVTLYGSNGTWCSVSS